MTLSELYTMPVEKAGLGSRGYVLGAIENGGRIEYLICCDDEDDEYCVRVDGIVSLDGRLIYDGREAKKPKAKALRLGAPCCDEQGRYLGRVEEFYIKNYTLKSAQIGGRRYAFDRLVRGDITIVRSRKRGCFSPHVAAKDLFIDAICS